jgi:ATP-dependent DNA helicase RecG
MHEAFILQTALLQQRETVRAMAATARPAGELLHVFDARLPFTRTADQDAVGTQIAADLEGPWPMNRLVQGEVGSGKTLVALRAMLQVAQSGGQSALIAPTEVLAAQHVRSIARMLGPQLAPELMPTLLTGQLPAAERRKAALRVAGQARIVVGTHALLSASTTFADLGLVVVDEQHRFGVEQRETLRAKGTAPHVLVLTATPIPRTVAMTVFGDLDVDHSGPCRPGQGSRRTSRRSREARVVRTRVGARRGRGRRWAPGSSCAPRSMPKRGTPAKDAADDRAVDVGAVEGEQPAPDGASSRSPDARRHPLVRRPAGRDPARQDAGEQKDAVMQAFAAGQIDVLVATTVVEVGVDVPNAPR